MSSREDINSHFENDYIKSDNQLNNKEIEDILEKFQKSDEQNIVINYTTKLSGLKENL
jgi:hypothetical protein